MKWPWSRSAAVGTDAYGLARFQCGDRAVVAEAYLAERTGPYSFPSWKSHPLRLSMERDRILRAQMVFGKFPVIMIWPEASDSQSNQFSWFTGVRITANCTAVPPDRGGRDIAEKLLIIWFQAEHLEVPDRVILPTL